LGEYSRLQGLVDLGIEVLTRLFNVKKTASLLYHFTAESIHPPTQSPEGFDPVAMIFTDLSQKGSVIVHTHERAKNVHPYLEPLAALPPSEHRLRGIALWRRWNVTARSMIVFGREETIILTVGSSDAVQVEV